jgi:purine-cytosine permease-like protein
MAAVTQPSDRPAAPRRSVRLPVRDVSVALAIAVIWIVVLLDALFGPDIIVNNASGFTRIPSAVVVVLFAYLATRVVAKAGFSQADRASRGESSTGAR